MSAVGQLFVRLLLLQQLARLLQRLKFTTGIRKLWAVLRALRMKIARQISGLLGRLNHWQRHLLMNLLIGLGIALALIPLHHSQWLMSVEDGAFDTLMKWDFGTRDFEEGPGQLWVDIDSATYLGWGEPIHTPRDRLAALLRAVNAYAPSAIIVDVNLDQAGGDAHADAALVSFLESYGSDCSSENCPPIFLPKGVRFDAPHPHPLWRPSRIPGLDAAVSENPLLHWVSPFQERSADWVVRRWILWQCVDQADGGLDVLPSFQLASLAATAGSDVGKVLAQVHGNALRQCAAQASGHSPDQDASDEQLEIGGQLIRANNSPIGRRIFYTMGIGKEGGLFTPMLTDQHGRRQPALLQVSAQNLLATDSKILPEIVLGRIVLIGASHHDIADVHRTPIGEMPGVLVVANTIHSLSQLGEVEPVANWQKLLIEAVLIIAMSLFFLWLDSFWGMVLSGLFVFFALLPLSFMLFREGVWLDFAIPLVAVQLHEIAAMFEEYAARARARSHAVKAGEIVE